jgi:hypothetical protein
MKTHFCRFSALDDLPKKSRCTEIKVLRLLAETGRFSSFEVDDPLARSLQKIQQNGWAVFDTTVPYPWTKVTMTDAGRAALAPPP